MIGGISWSLLFDLGASDSLISPFLVEKYKISMAKEDDKW